MTNKFEISIIIPTYNRVTALKKTLRLIVDQTFPREKYEVLVVDDCSKDETKMFLANNAKLLNIKYLSNDRNLGRAKTRNRAIRAASGDYILMIDDDIWVERTFIEAHYKRHLDSGKDIAVVGAILVSDEVQLTGVNKYLNNHHLWCYHEMKRYRGSLPYGFCKTASLSLKREVLLKVGLFNEGFVKYGAEDSELGYRLIRSGIEIFFEPDAIGYHFHDEKVSSLISRSISLGETHFFFRSQHSELREQQEYSGFFTPCFHRSLSFRTISYNFLKAILFNTFARNINRLMVTLLDNYPSKFTIIYLIPILRMQYKRYGMKRIGR